MKISSIKLNYTFVVILAALWSLDRAAKLFALTHLPAQAVYRNHGMAFGILKGYPSVCLFLALLGIGLFAVAIIKYGEAFLTLGVVFLLAGALGNAADRLIYGYVIDWINFAGYININLADVWLCAGVLLLLKNISAAPETPPNDVLFKNEKD